MEEAAVFIAKQPVKAQQKIYYNIFKVEEGIREIEIFKKLENTDIWEFRTLYNGICYRLSFFLQNSYKIRSYLCADTITLQPTS